MGALLQTNNSTIARWWRRRASRHISRAAPVVLGGCQRSGTTLLRVILDAHPHLACGPETSLFTGGFLPAKLAARFDMASQQIWEIQRHTDDHAQFIDTFFDQYAADRHKQRWGDKTPQNVRYLDWIFQHFPQAKFIHVIRDGRDVVCSIRTHPRFRMMNGVKVPTHIRRPLKPCIQAWLDDTAAGIQWRGHPGYFEMRYEDLITQTEETLRKICAFINEPFDAVMLEYYANPEPSRDAARFVTNEAATRPLSRDAWGRWASDLTRAEQALFETLAGKRMRALGYDMNLPARSAAPAENLRS